MNFSSDYFLFHVDRFAKEYLDKKARKALEITEMTVCLIAGVYSIFCICFCFCFVADPVMHNIYLEHSDWLLSNLIGHLQGPKSRRD